MFNNIDDIFSIYKDDEFLLENYVKNETDFKGLQILTEYLINKNRYNPESSIKEARLLNKIKFSMWLQYPKKELYNEVDYLKKFYKILSENGDSSITQIDLYQDNKLVHKLKAPHENIGGFNLIGEIASFVDCDDIHHDLDFDTNQSKIKEVIYIIYYFISIFLYSRLKKYSWKFNNKKYKVRKENVLFFKLSQEETKKLRNKARKEKVNFLYYFLFKVNTILKKELISENQDTEWLMPINKKPYNLINKKYSKSYNDYSFLPLTIRKDDTAKDIKKEIGKNKKSKKWLRVYIENLIFIYLNKYINLYKKFKKENKSSFASLSYFGVANVPFSNDTFFVGKTNPSRLCPITVSCGVLNGEFIASFDIRDEYLRDKTHLYDIIIRIKDELVS